MASYAPFHITVTNVSGALFDGDALMVVVPGVDGVLTILAHHEPLISLLKKGLVHITTPEGKVTEYEIETGVLEVNKNRATVLV